MINPELASQLNSLRAQASASTVPSGLLSWWGALTLPDGSAASPAISYGEWQTYFAALRQASLTPGFVPAQSTINAMTASMSNTGPVPIAIASYSVSAPTSAFRAEVVQAANSGSALSGIVPPLADILETRDVFCAAAALHDQWARTTPVLRSRVVSWSIDERFYFAPALEPLPDHIEFDAGDGRGWRTVHFGDVVMGAYPTGDSATFAVRCTWGSTVQTARGTLQIGGPVTPAPDDAWSLRANNGNAGTAFVYRAPDHVDVVNPVIVAEGFPGGYASDYLYELLNQQGLLESLRARGFDVILLAFANGADLIENNAAVVVSCIANAMGRTQAPMAVGGVSMGGLCTRYALAWMEQRGIPHNTRTYFSVDTPHAGSTTPVSVQWFADFFRTAMPMAEDFSTLLATPADQEFLRAYLSDGVVQVSPMRTWLLQQFEHVGGYPQLPRRIAVSCGRGNGGASIPPGYPLLTWTGSPFASCSLFSEGTGNTDAIVAEGECFLAPASPRAVLRMTSATSWEGVPGGQENYVAIAGAIAQTLACGEVLVQSPNVCVVPTISALDIAQDPLAPIPPAGTGRSPFHDYICSEQDQQHLVLTEATASWLLSQLTVAPAPASAS